MFNTDNVHVTERQLKKYKMQKLAKMYGLCKIKTTPKSDIKAKITTCLINNFFHLP